MSMGRSGWGFTVSMGLLWAGSSACSSYEGSGAGEDAGTERTADTGSTPPVSCQPAGAAPILASGTATLDTEAQAQSTYDLERGTFGQVVQDGEVLNRNSHVSFGEPPGSLRVGIQGGERGFLVRLGSDAEVAARIPGNEACSGFDRLALVGDSFADPDAASVFGPSSNGASALAVPGSVYVLRIERTGADELLAKLRVTAVDANRSVTFEWARLPPR